MLKSWVKLYHRPLRKQTSTRKTITNKGTRLYKNQSRTKEEIKKKRKEKRKRKRWEGIQKEEILGKKQGENQSPFFYFHWFCIGLIVLSLLNSGEVCISKSIV